jgi:glycine oxidase
VRILVIGAGIIGASVAQALARRGASVTVLDMRGAGRGASWASAGLLAPFTEAEEDSPLQRLGARSLALYDQFTETAAASSGRSIEYARTGTLEVALTDDEAKHLLDEKQRLENAGVRLQWIAGDDLRAFEPALSSSAAGGLFVRDHGFVGVPGLVSALAQSASFAGASFESPVEAIDVSSDARGVDVRADQRRYRADHVVLAAGTWTGRIRVKGLPPLPVHPVRGQLLHLRWAATPRPRHVVWSTGCYAVPWSDGRLLVGATVEDVGFDESVTVSGIQSLTAAVSAMLPGAGYAELIEARAGLRPATPDGLPFIGPVAAAPHVTVAAGHYRNGVLLAPVTAAMVEASILDGNRDEMMVFTDPNRDLRR